MSNLPNWPGASACYSRAYRLLETWAPSDVTPMHSWRGRRVCTSARMDELIDALNRGGEEMIKGILLENRV